MPNLKGQEIIWKGKSIIWKETLVEKIIKQRRLRHVILLEGDEKTIQQDEKAIKEHIRTYYL